MIELLSISGLMLIFSINALMGGLFVLTMVPETKERSFQEILNTLQQWKIPMGLIVQWDCKWYRTMMIRIKLKGNIILCEHDESYASLSKRFCLNYW